MTKTTLFRSVLFALLIGSCISANAGVGHFVAGAVVGAAFADSSNQNSTGPLAVESSSDSVICDDVSYDGNKCDIVWDSSNHRVDLVVTFIEFISYTNKIPVKTITIEKLIRQFNEYGHIKSVIIEYSVKE